MKIVNWDVMEFPFPSESIIASDRDSGEIFLNDGSAFFEEPLQNCKMIIGFAPLILIAEDSMSYSNQNDYIAININIPSKGVYVWHFSSEEFFPPEEIPPVPIYCTSIINRKYHILDENYLPDEIKAGRVYPESYHGEVFNNYVNNRASGVCSHAEGSRTTANADFSHAEGHDTIASGWCSHAEGDGTTASGHSSHAEGSGTTASADYSHAEGDDTIASGYCSHAEGWSTKASGDYSHVQGKYNIEDLTNKYAHIVGNGTSNARSNAHTLDWSGNAWYAGAVECDGIILTAPNGIKYQITITDDGTLSAHAISIPMPT